MAGASIDSALQTTLGQLPITNEECVGRELSLYRQIQQLAGKHGWLFADNLESLRAHGNVDSLYNKFDYHVTNTASQIIGDVQARTIANVTTTE